MSEGSIDVVMGTQWGDEGKGKLVDYLAPESDLVVRYAGANNAGHTVVKEGYKLALHLVPSGICHPGTYCVIGNGVLLEPISLVEEIQAIQEVGVSVTPSNLGISDTAHLIFPHHIALDEAREANGGGNGSTKRGVSFAAAEKYGRTNHQVNSLGNFPA
jgi:adenylosuccinate synthase